MWQYSVVDLIWLQRAMPSMTGIMMSLTTRSTRSLPMSLRASSPLAATRTLYSSDSSFAR